jgi:hypothetical protein
MQVTSAINNLLLIFIRTFTQAILSQTKLRGKCNIWTIPSARCQLLADGRSIGATLLHGVLTMARGKRQKIPGVRLGAKKVARVRQ